MEIEIPLPDLQTQKQIAQVLEDADRARQQRKAANALTEQFLQSSFLHLFGDPAKNEKSWLKQSIKSLALKYSDGPFGSNLKSEHYTNDGVLVIRLENIGINLFKDSSRTFIPVEHYKKLEKHSCFPGDVIIGTMGEPNLRACILPDYFDVAINKADCVLFRPDTKIVVAEYVSHLLNIPSFVKSVSNLVLGQTRGRISMGRLSTVEIPVPPISLQQYFASLVADAEVLRQKQQRSERELEHLFQSLLQKYFGQRAAEDEEMLPMAAEPQKTYNSSPAPSIPASKKGFAKYVLAGKIVKECRETKDFGHIKFQKLQHLAEYLLEEDLAQNYYYQAAGPYDNQLMHNLANKLSQQGWYREEDYKFIPLEKEVQIDTHFQRYFGDKAGRLRHLIDLLGNASEAQCEIVSTLYAVWNDLLIAKTPFTDEDIIQRFYDWSDRKSRYTRNQLTKALAWMRENKIVPSGFGLIIKHKNEKP